MLSVAALVLKKMYRSDVTCRFTCSWFPPGLEIRENLEKWEGIFQSGNFVKTGKVRGKSGNFTQNTGKIRKNYTGKLKRILKKSGKFVSQ